MKQKLQKYLDDCIKLRIPPFFDIVLSSLRRFVSRTKRFRPLDYACLSVELRVSGNIWLVSFKISYLCLPLFYETRTTPSCHPSGCAYRQL